MAADDLLAALHGNYGGGEPPTDDLGTVRGLLNFSKKWTEGRVGAADLHKPCLSMAGRLRGGAEEMAADLAANPDMAYGMREPIQRTLEAYRSIADVLEELPAFAKDENRTDFLDDLEVFEDARQAVLDAQEEIQFQLSGRVLICPRCGGQGEGTDCPKCLLVRMYPDPQATRARTEEQARLSGIYAKAYKGYRAILQGRKSLTTLVDALFPLQEHLESLVQTRKQFTKKVRSRTVHGQRAQDMYVAASILASIDDDIQTALLGAERMRGAERSLKMSDLYRGWEDVFHAAQRIEAGAYQLWRRFSPEAEEAAVKVDPGDIISFTGERD